MTVLITLTLAGANVGPFNLYSNVDGFTTAFELGVSKAALLSGYSSSLVPDYTTTIRLVSTGECTNYFDILIDLFPTTTTTTTTATPTTTTTTTTTTPSENNLIINNLYSSVSVDGVSAGFCSIATSAPFGPGIIDYGDIGVCTSDIGLEFSGTSPSGHCMSLIVNGVIEQEVSFNADGTYVFTSTPPITSTDIVVIVIRDGVCLSAREGVVSATSSPTDACPIPMTITCWVTGNTDIVDGLIVYTDPGMTTPFLFVGNGDFYHIQLNAYVNSYSIIIDGFGETDAVGAVICA